MLSIIKLVEVEVEVACIGDNATWVSVAQRRRGAVVMLSESDVSVRLSRGPALITRWLDAESKVVVLGTTSSKWPGLTPTDRPNCPSTLKIITFARCFF